MQGGRLFATYAAAILYASSSSFAGNIPNDVPRTILTQRAQQPYLSQQLVDLVDANYQQLVSTKPHDFVNRKNNTTYGNLFYSHRSTWEREGDLATEETSLTLGNSDESRQIRIIKHNGQTWLEASVVISYLDGTTRTDVYVEIRDRHFNGKFNLALDPKFHWDNPKEGLALSKFLDRKDMKDAEIKTRQFKFEDIITDVTFAIRNYLKLD